MPLKEIKLPMPVKERAAAEWETVLSDHNILIAEGPPKTMSWNVMCQGSYKAAIKRSNNGFNHQESDEEYARRLERILAAIQQMVTQEGVEAIMLQEMPNPDKHKDFYLKLNQIKNKQGHPLVYMNDVAIKNTSGFCNVTIFDPDRFEDPKFDMSGDGLKHTQESRITVLKGKIKVQGGASVPCELVNIHGDYTKPAETAAVVKHYQKKGTGIVAGDLNISTTKPEHAAALKTLSEGSYQQAANFSTVDMVAVGPTLTKQCSAKKSTEAKVETDAASKMRKLAKDAQSETKSKPDATVVMEHHTQTQAEPEKVLVALEKMRQNFNEDADMGEMAEFKRVPDMTDKFQTTIVQDDVTSKVTVSPQSVEAEGLTEDMARPLLLSLIFSINPDWNGKPPALDLDNKPISVDIAFSDIDEWAKGLHMEDFMDVAEEYGIEIHVPEMNYGMKQ